MWIGLFYSRSTPRSFHFEADCLSPCIEERDTLNMPTSVGPALAQSFAPCLNFRDTSDGLSVNALDLSEKDGFALDHGGDVLDLSQRNAQAKPHAKQRQTSGFDGQKEAGATQIVFESATDPLNVSTYQAWISQHYSCLNCYWSIEQIWFHGLCPSVLKLHHAEIRMTIRLLLCHVNKVCP